MNLQCKLQEVSLAIRTVIYRLLTRCWGTSQLQLGADQARFMSHGSPILHEFSSSLKASAVYLQELLELRSIESLR